MTFGKLILKNRLNKRLGLNQCSRLTGISNCSWSLIENDQRVPHLTIALKMLKVLGVPLNDLNKLLVVKNIKTQKGNKHFKHWRMG